MKSIKHSDSKYFTLKMNRSSFYEFERLRTELSEQNNKIVTKVDMLDYLLEIAKNKAAAS
ncbi:hypothetical protein ACMA1I_18330 [Pontibacter sp. 13R65]|uniref:hypothetical protein n=1 Tax=Pontibacter sp. 13R65 TaxID=3127458 RepID=UPI00301D4E06